MLEIQLWFLIGVLLGAGLRALLAIVFDMLDALWKE